MQTHTKLLVSITVSMLVLLALVFVDGFGRSSISLKIVSDEILECGSFNLVLDRLVVTCTRAGPPGEFSTMISFKDIGKVMGVVVEFRGEERTKYCFATKVFEKKDYTHYFVQENSCG